MKYIDLTHTISTSIPTWDGSCGFSIKNILASDDCTTGTTFCIQEATLKMGIGTHIDAPLHCFPNSTDVAKLQLDDLIVPMVVIDVAHKTTPSYALSAQDIQQFESIHGVIKPSTFVLAYTGWGKKWPDQIEYRNQQADGYMLFPHFSSEAAQLLIERDICGIGIDTLSPDCGPVNFPIHELLLSHGKYIVENVLYVDKLPTTDLTVCIAPLKIDGATECPVRMFAFLSS